jgi:hypothetical protein
MRMLHDAQHNIALYGTRVRMLNLNPRGVLACQWRSFKVDPRSPSSLGGGTEITCVIFRVNTGVNTARVCVCDTRVLCFSRA